MRILAIADIHGDRAIYREIVRLAEERCVDAVVLAGDLLGAPPGFDSIEAAQQRDAVEILEVLTALSRPVLYVLGNDDLVPMPDTPPHVHALHGRRLDLGGWGFVGYQYSPPFMGGPLEKPEAEIAADLVGLEPLLDPTAVLVTHCPADGILDGSNTFRPEREFLASVGVHLVPGSPAIRDAVRRRGVRAHVHGHVHGAFGRAGCHSNVESGPGSLRAMIVDLATLDHQVVLLETTRHGSTNL